MNTKKQTRTMLSFGLAASLLLTIPTQTNCGFLNFCMRNKYIFKTIGHYALACGFMLAASGKVKLPTPFFYLTNIGGTFLGAAKLPDSIRNLRSPGASQANIFTKSYTIMKAIEAIGLFSGSLLSLIAGPSIAEKTNT